MPRNDKGCGEYLFVLQCPQEGTSFSLLSSRWSAATDGDHLLSARGRTTPMASTACHREPSQMAWRSSYNRVAHTRGHNLLDCFAPLAMTRDVVRRAMTRGGIMCRSGTAYPVRILVFVQTALLLVFTYSDSSRGSIATVAIQ